MRFSDFLLVGDPGDLDFIVGYTEDENIRISVSDFFGNQIDGSGNPGYIPVFTSTQVLGNSQIFQDGANIVIGGVNAMGYRLAVGGSLYAANGAVIESSILGSNTFRAIGEEGNSFIIPHDLDESIFTPRTIIHAPAVLTTQSATLGQVNTAISTLEGDIDILLDLKVDESSVGAPNGVASLDSGGKVPLSEIPDSIIGQVQYMGTWNAFTNTPTLNPLVPEEKGHYYVVSAAGVFGGVDYQVGDWIISNGVIWEKVDNTDAVTSVFGRIGAILALEGDYQAFYPRLSQTYDNPTWINTLAFTKITGVPAFLLENQTITLSGDVTGSGKTSIASTISNNAVTDSKLRDSVGTSVIGRSASTTGDPADIQATTDGHVLLRSAGNLLFGLISGDSISSIDWSKITGTPTTLSGYGITNAYTKTESDNKFVPYTGASANVNLGSNNITANSFIKAGGTSSQFLKADGSVDTSQYVPTTRSVNAGTGLTGGGNLSSDITIAFDTTWGDNRYAYRTRQITINGVTFDLSADRTYNVGTVTSVGLSAPTGFSVSNSPVTTSGTLSLSFATGYSLPTSASQITWDTAYNNSIISASVTGTETKLLTLTQQDGGTITASWSDFDTAPVTSVFGRLGAIIAQSGDYTTTLVTEGTNLYFTDSRARQSISLTTIGTNGPATYSNVTGVFNIPNYSTDLSGYVPYTGANQTVNLNTQQLQAGHTTLTTNGSTETLTINHTSGSGKAINVTKGGNSEGLYINKTSGSGNAATIVGTLEATTLVKTGGTSAQFLKADGSVDSTSYGTVSSVAALTLGTSGTDLSSSVVNSTTTPVITLNVPTASAVNRGALSAADWTTFNSKQNAITLTTTGTSGVSTLIGSTLNIPNYTTDLSGYVTLATDQTITGLKTIQRVGAAIDVLNFKIGTDTLYALKIAYNQNELAPSGEATWSFASTFNNGSGTGLTTTPISFFRGVLVTGQRLVSASVNTNILDYYGNNPSGRYPIYAYNTGVQQFASSIIVGETTGVVDAITGAIADLPAGVVANFKGRVIGSNAVNNDEFVTLGQVTSTSRAAISLTTTGTSGPATYSSVTGVLNIPEYQGGVTSFNTRTGAVTLTSLDVTTALGFNPVTDARTLTINGVTYDLTENRTWTVGVNPSAREIETFIATSGQTVFTVTGGYTVGLVDVYINGVRLTSSDYTATNGTTVVLTVGTMVGNIVDIIKYTSGFTNPIAGTLSTGQVAFGTATNTIGGDNGLFWDNTNKRLGVGTNIPASELEVLSADSATAIRISSGLASTTTGTSTLRLQSFNSASGLIGSAEISNTAPAGGQSILTFATSASANNPTERWRINNTGIFQSNGAQTIQTSSGVLTLQGNGGNTIINPTSGNVGIGTSVPTSRLSVISNSTTEIAIRLRNSDSGTNAYSILRLNNDIGENNASQGLFFLNSSTRTGDGGSNAMSIRNNIGALRLMSTSGADLSFWTSTSAERMRITSSGNVLIGSPPAADNGARLQVSGIVKIQGGVNNVNSFSTTTSDQPGFVSTNNSTVETSTNILYSKIYGSAVSATAFGNSTNSKAILAVDGSTNTGLLIGCLNNQNLIFGTNNTERMRITSDGNVGIGTDSPSGLLHLKKDFTSGIAITLDRTANANVDNLFYLGVSNAGSTATDYMWMGTATSSFVIRGDGNVGIGKTAPAYKLELSTDSAAKPSTALWTIASDSRIKENITPYENGLNELMKINPINYDYNGLGGFTKGKGGVGIIAQEICEILPDSVSSFYTKLNENDEEDTEIFNFNGHELIYVLINSIKELKQEIDTLKN